jgi:large repetitive protein
MIKVLRSFIAICLALSLIQLSYYPVHAVSVTISGKVIDENGNPISNARVLSDEVGYPSALTNGSGDYTLSGITNTSAAHLRAAIVGKSMSHYWNYSVSNGQIVNFTLRPGGGTISGRVINASNAGISNATVDVWENTGVGADGVNNGAWVQTTSDANGYFTTSPTYSGGLPTGSMRVRAYSGVSGWNYSVAAFAGQQTSGVQIGVNLGTGSITGRITDKTSHAGINGVQVVADNGLVMAGANTDINGNYLITGLPSSSYNVVANKTGYASAHSYSIQVLEPSSTNNVNFELTNAKGSITGRVTDANNAPLGNVGIMADSDQGTGFGSASTDINGYYTLPNLSPMTYYVHAYKTGYSSLIRMGTVTNGATTSGIDFKLGSADRKISGQITKDGTPAAYASIFANSSGTNSSPYYSNTKADANGFYTLVDLVPDKYDVHVFDVPGYSNQVIFGIDINGQNRSGLNFNLMNGTSIISGHVTDSLGNPLSGVTIQPFNNANPGTYATVTTDVNGNYYASGLWSGLYTLYASAANFETAIKHFVDIPANANSRIDFKLGGSRFIQSSPNQVSVFVKGSFGTQFGARVEASAGSASWTASTPASWLYLGSSGNLHSISGNTGDLLVLRFEPAGLNNGTYTTSVTITSPTAQSGSIQVTMVKTDKIFLTFLPMNKK